MANRFLVQQREVALPMPPPQEQPVMADADVFPRWCYPAGGPSEPDYGGRQFNSKEELDAAEGQWFATPQLAQAARPAAPAPAPDDDEPHARRSHR
jgi:hypothetical protein